MFRKSSADSYIGDSAIFTAERKEILDIDSPFQHGIVTNWDAMEKIWDYMFSRELRVSPDNQCLLVTEPPLNPKSNREMMAQVLFERFNVPASYVVIPGQLSAYSNGRGTCMVVDIGETVTHTFNVYEGFTFRDAIKRVDIGGRELNQYLQKLMMNRGYCFTTFSEIGQLRDIKEKLCFIKPTKTDTVKDSLKNKSVVLADVGEIQLKDECTQCPEVLFDPSLIGSSAPGIHQLVYESILACEYDVRRDLYPSICLSGGSTMFPGIKQRLTNELTDLFPQGTKFKVIAPPERRASVWIGGSIMASLTTFQDKWITKLQYDEYGPNVIHKYIN